MKNCLDRTLLHTSALGRLDSIGRNEFWASLALKYTKGLGLRSCKKLFTYFGSAYTAVQNIGAWRDAQISKDKVLEFRLEKWRPLAKEEWDSVRGCYGSILLWNDKHYPSILKEISDPPIFLYCLGDTSLLLNTSIAVVGTRKCSIDGMQKSREMARGLSNAGITVVSGLAVGIDREAHISSVDLSGSTIAVLGSGINVDYPRQNLDIRKKIISKGLIISEYAPNTPPEPNFFPTRNRIISGISLGVLIVEAALQSGSLITARLALEQNRSVYAISGSINSPFSQGCQDIISQGACAVSNLNDILNDLFIPLKTSLKKKTVPYEAQSKNSENIGENKKKKKSLNSMDKEYSEDTIDSFIKGGLEELVLDALKTNSRDIEDLCQLLQVTPDSLASTLIMLEVRGIVKRLPNTQYMCVGA